MKNRIFNIKKSLGERRGGKKSTGFNRKSLGRAVEYYQVRFA